MGIFSLLAHSQPLAAASDSSKDSSPEVEYVRYPKRKRAEVKYFSSDEADDPSDSEIECVPIKRTKPTRATKPLPPHKIFPFTSLPAELRNRIYEECLSGMPNICQEAKYGEKGTICFRSKQRAYRRSVEQFLPDEGILLDMEQNDHLYSHNLNWRGTARGRPAPSTEEDEDEEEVPRYSLHKKLGLNILALNKAIYDEVAPMIYGQRLIFVDTVALMAFAALLSPKTAKLIRHIEVRCWNLTRSRKSKPFSAMAILAAKGVTNVEKFHINCTVGYYQENRHGAKVTPVAKRVARKVYRDCFLWLETVARAKMMKGKSWWAGVDILEMHALNYGYSYTWKNEHELIDEANKTFKTELKRLLRPNVG